MSTRAVMLSAVVVLVCTSCGRASTNEHTQRLLRNQQVVAAFARAGVRFSPFALNGPGGNVKSYDYFPKSGGDARLEFAVLPEVKPLRDALRIVGETATS